MKPVKAWHFVAKDKKLGHGDGRIVEPGWIYYDDGADGLCKPGLLHGSVDILDALAYAPYDTGWCCRVRIGGKIIKGDDKLGGTEREVLWMVPTEQVLPQFARWCALQVIDLWKSPEIVRQYLETGDELLLSAAQAAAARAARAAWAAQAAAEVVAASDAARAAARAAAARAAAARAARAAEQAAAARAARAAVREKQSEKLEQLVREARGT